MSIADPNKTILTGENPFIRLSLKDGDPNSTDASYWRIILSPAGPGHVLYLKSELTEGRWRIYSDNIALARWLQTTVLGMLNAELSDTTISCAEATFPRPEIPATSGLNTSSRTVKTSRSPGSISASRCSSTHSRTRSPTGVTAYALY
jgi:hypothetical protein